MKRNYKIVFTWPEIFRNDPKKNWFGFLKQNFSGPFWGKLKRKPIFLIDYLFDDKIYRTTFIRLEHIEKNLL